MRVRVAVSRYIGRTAGNLRPMLADGFRGEPAGRAALPAAIRTAPGRHGRGPGIGTHVGADAELHPATGGIHRVHHLLVAGQRHGGVLRAVEGPDGQVHDAFGAVAVAGPADRRDGGQPVGVVDGVVPGAVAAHAQPCQQHTVGVDRQPRHQVGAQRFERIAVPGHALGHLRRDQHEREVSPRHRILRRAMRLDLLEVVAALARAVQEDQQRPARCGSACGLGHPLQVAKRHALADDGAEAQCLFATGWRGANGAARCQRRGAHRRRPAQELTTLMHAQFTGYRPTRFAPAPVCAPIGSHRPGLRPRGHRPTPATPSATARATRCHRAA